MAVSPDRRDILCLDAAYHGSTLSTVACSPYKFRYQAGLPAASHIHVCKLPNQYAGVGVEEAVGDVRQRIDAIQSSGGRVLAFIHESSPSCAGQLLLPPGYLSSVYAAVRAAGGVCIADEVQSGLGRNGCTWWEFERQSVVPDIVTAGKALGGGVYPVAAAVTSSHVSEQFTATGYEYFNTYGGTNAAAAVGLAVLSVMRSEARMQHAHTLGAYWLTQLCRLQSAHSLIGDVRGIGLFIGIEISQPDSRQPAAREAAWLVNRMRAMEDEYESEGQQQQQQQREQSASSSTSCPPSTVLSGVLLSTDGPSSNVIKVKPPLCIERSDVDCMLRLFSRALIEWEQSCGSVLAVTDASTSSTVMHRLR